MCERCCVCVRQISQTAIRIVLVCLLHLTISKIPRVRGSQCVRAIEVELCHLVRIPENAGRGGLPEVPEDSAVESHRALEGDEQRRLAEKPGLQGEVFANG